jgi:hypothetical protein
LGDEKGGTGRVFRHDVGHPGAVRWIDDAHVVVEQLQALVPTDPILEPWSVGGYAPLGTRHIRVRIDRAGTMSVVDGGLIHPEERALEAAIAALVPPEEGWKPAPAPASIPDVVREAEGCPSEIHSAEAHCAGQTCLWALRDADDRDGCAVVRSPDGVRTLRTANAPTLLMGEAIACVTPVVHGLGGARGGYLCVERARPDRIAVLPEMPERMSGAALYAARPLEGPWLEGFVPTVFVESEGAVVYGKERWAGPADVSMQWQAVHGNGQVRFRVRVTDDLVAPGPDPQDDHLEIDVGGGPNPRHRFAVQIEDGAGRVMVWRRDSEEVVEPLENSHVRFAVVDGGYTVDVRLPIQALEPEEGLPVPVALRVSDGEDGQTILASQTALTFPARWPPLAR